MSEKKFCRRCEEELGDSVYVQHSTKTGYVKQYCKKCADLYHYLFQIESAVEKAKLNAGLLRDSLESEEKNILEQ